MSLRPGPNALRIGEWIADPGDDSLTRGTERQRIDSRAMQLLLRLAKSPGEVVSQNTLLDDVWAGVVVSPASVYQSISQLRKALGDTETPPSYIETVARKGYRLVATVSRVVEDTPPPAPVVTGVATGVAEPAPPPFAAVPTAPPPKKRRRVLPWIAAAVVLLATAGGVTAWLTQPVPDSIIVLPFDDLTQAKDQKAFCDGMTEELSNWLAQIPGLRVVARTTAFEFRDKDMDVREIGKQVGATHVLEGSLRRSGNILRVTVQLTETKLGYHLWSRNYNVLVDDLLQTQEQIARQVAANLQLRLTLETDKLFAQRRSKSPLANRAYVLGKAQRQRATQVDNQAAIVLFKEALGHDPDFALAKIELINAYVDQRYYDDRTLEEIGEDVEPLFADLEKSAGNLAEFWIARGMWRNDDLRREEAIQDLERATEIDPDSPNAAAMLGFVHYTLAQPRDAARQFELAVALDPLNVRRLSLYCRSLVDLGDYSAAQEQCNRARAIEPDSTAALTALSELEAERGDAAAALKWSTLALHGPGNVAELYSERGRWLMRLGLVEEAHRTYVNAAAATGEAGARNTGLVGLGLRSTFAVEGADGVRRLITSTGISATEDPDMMFQLADSLLMIGDARAAREQVAKALASPKLKAEQLASPWDAHNGRSYLLIAAAAERATGDTKLAAEHLAAATAVVEKLVNAGVRRHDVYQLRAALAAMRGDAAAAMEALNTASELGWRYVWLAENLPYFETLRGREDFQALIARIRARNASDGARILAVINTPPGG